MFLLFCVFFSLLLFETKAFGDNSPNLFFLFLVRERIENPDIWGSFFNSNNNHTNGNSSENLRSFQIFIHSMSKNRTRDNLVGGYPFYARNSKKIKSTRNNTHHGLMNLLKSALPFSEDSRDKFMLISNNAIPIKSMREMRDALFQYDGSDICVLPSNNWIRTKTMDEIYVGAASHEWMVLNKADAVKVVRLYPKFPDIPDMIQNMPATYEPPFFDGDGAELTFMAYLYGTMMLKHKFNFAFDYPCDREQGTCRTFTWRKDLPPKSVFREPFDTNFNGFPGLPTDEHKMMLSNITLDDLRKIRNSKKFLIARKFEDKFMISKGGKLIPGIDALEQLEIFA